MTPGAERETRKEESPNRSAVLGGSPPTFAGWHSSLGRRADRWWRNNWATLPYQHCRLRSPPPLSTSRAEKTDDGEIIGRRATPAKLPRLFVRRTRPLERERLTRARNSADEPSRESRLRHLVVGISHSGGVLTNCGGISLQSVTVAPAAPESHPRA